MRYVESVRFVAGHTRIALAMALIFGSGLAASVPVMRARFEPLMAVPRWFAALLTRILGARPSFARLALFIFVFNGLAMFVYMLTGLIPFAPAFIAFWTGLNVAVAGYLARESQEPGTTPRQMTFATFICMVLTFLLELPCFWYSMGLGWTMQTTFFDLLKADNTAPVIRRIEAYVIVILPVIALSACAEAYAITSVTADKSPDGADEH